MILEDNLQKAFKIIDKATEQNSFARQKAARWFNRLYYDLSRWNAKFVQLLRDYPPLHGNYTESQLKEYERRFRHYADAMDGRETFVSEDGEEDICARLDFLAGRLNVDFAWLKKDDPRAFDALSDAIGCADLIPTRVRSMTTGVATTVIHFQYSVLKFRAAQSKKPDVTTVRESIEQYVQESQHLLRQLWQEGRQIKLLFLSVTEYDEALHRDGSANPQLYVVGEVSMPQNTYHIDSRGGILNLESTLTNATQLLNTTGSMSASDNRALQDLIAKLETELSRISAQAPADVQRIAVQVENAARELANPKPDKGFLQITSAGLKHAASAVKDIAPAVLATVDALVQFLARYSQ